MLVSQLDHRVTLFRGEETVQGHDPRWGGFVQCRTDLWRHVIEFGGLRMDPDGVNGRVESDQRGLLHFRQVGAIPRGPSDDAIEHFVQISRIQGRIDVISQFGTTLIHINQVTGHTGWCAIGFHVGGIIFAFTNDRPESTEFIAILTLGTQGFVQFRNIIRFHVLDRFFDSLQGIVLSCTFNGLEYSK